MGTPFSQAEYDAAAARICELSAHVNAAHAEMAKLAADFDDRELWAGYGIRTCRHWLTINTGVSEHSANELVRVGHALSRLPQLHAAFASGQLSLDKMRLVTRVATSADEDIWLQLALYASGAQLARIVRGYEASGDDGSKADQHRAARGLWTFWRPDGMLDLHAVLTAEDGAVVLAALDAVAERTGTPKETPTAILQSGRSMQEASAAALDPADDPQSSRRADALAMMSEAVLSGSAEELVSNASAYRLVAHVDLGVLTGEDPGGRSQVEDGPGISAAVARRIGCDAEVIAIAERDGKPIDVGRRRRFPSGRLQMAVKARDRSCRFPGCPVRAKYGQMHHVRFWGHGGLTKEDNLLTLCRFHHGRHHDGAFGITLAEDRRPVFLDPWGRPIGEPAGPPLVPFSRGEVRRLLRGNADAITGDTPVALDHGARFDLGLTTELLHLHCSNRKVLAEADASP